MYSCTRTAVHVHFVLSKINTLRKLVCSLCTFVAVYSTRTCTTITFVLIRTEILSYESTKVRRYFRTPEVQLHVRKYYLSSKVSCYEGNKLYCTVRVRVRVQLYTYEDNSTRTTVTYFRKYFRTYLFPDVLYTYSTCTLRVRAL